MHLSLDEAAVELGVTARQVRYLIQTGRLPATKRQGRWTIRREDLPLRDGAARAETRHGAQLRATVEQVLGPSENRRRYSMMDMRAFLLGVPLLRELCRELGATHAAATQLALVMDLLAVGCHRFEKQSKIEAYSAARDAASRCACALYLDDKVGFAVRVEQDILPCLAGLLRRAER